METPSLVDVIVVTYNSTEDVRACLDSIIASGARPVVVDNGSQDDTLQVLHSEYPCVNLLLDPHNSYARAANLGISNSNSRIAIVSNADVVYPENAIAAMVDYISHHTDIGVLGPQQVYPDGSWQRSWGLTPGLCESLVELLGFTSLYNAIRRTLWPGQLNRRPTHVGYLDGAVLVINRDAFDAVDGFDPDFPFYAEEADLCMRMRKAGWKVVALPMVEVVHRRGGSSTKADMLPARHVAVMVEASEKLIRKHYGERYLSWYLRIKRLFNVEMTGLLGMLVHIAPRQGRAAIRNKILVHEAYRNFFSSHKPQVR